MKGARGEADPDDEDSYSPIRAHFNKLQETLAGKSDGDAPIHADGSARFIDDPEELKAYKRRPSRKPPAATNALPRNPYSRRRVLQEGFLSTAPPSDRRFRIPIGNSSGQSP